MSLLYPGYASFDMGHPTSRFASFGEDSSDITQWRCAQVSSLVKGGKRSLKTQPEVSLAQLDLRLIAG